MEMRMLPMTDARAPWTYRAGRSEGGSVDDLARQGEEGMVDEFPSRINWETRFDYNVPHWGRGEFFRNLSTQAIREFESISEAQHCRGTTVLISEEQVPSDVVFLLEGRLKLSINSIDGRRLIVAIAWPGEILGLTSVMAGCPHVITAEAQFHCMIRSLQRQDFLDFLMRHPMASQNVMRELSLDYNRTAQKLRTLGLILTAPAKLARLFLEWCKEGVQTKCGVRIQCSLTHGEIGEHIGASRETISRIMKDFKSQGLVEQRGSILIIPDLAALEACECAI
jgi:CRP/FNR family cyclic AMP-dependent transcriptional regulator